MAFKIATDGQINYGQYGIQSIVVTSTKDTLACDSGIPAMYGSGDVTTVPSYREKIQTPNNQFQIFGQSISVGSGRIIVGDDLNHKSYVYELSGNLLFQLVAADSDFSGFGKSVNVYNGRIVVGAPRVDLNKGAVYVFDLNGNQLYKFTGSDSQSDYINSLGQSISGDQFARAVAVDNDRIVVGAPYRNRWTGAAYIFDLSGNEIAKLTLSDGVIDNYFGDAVAIGNGRVVVGARGYMNYKGSAYVYDLDGNLIKTIVSTSTRTFNQFGIRVAIGNGRIVILAIDGCYIYDLDGNFIKKAVSTNSNDSNFSVTIGNGRIVVGDTSNNALRVFDLDGNQITKINSPDGANSSVLFGYSVSLKNGILITSALRFDNTSNAAIYVYDTPEVITPYDVQDWERV